MSHRPRDALSEPALAARSETYTPLVISPLDPPELAGREPREYLSRSGTCSGPSRSRSSSRAVSRASTSGVRAAAMSARQTCCASAAGGCGDRGHGAGRAQKGAGSVLVASDGMRGMPPLPRLVSRPSSEHGDPAWLRSVTGKAWQPRAAFLGLDAVGHAAASAALRRCRYGQPASFRWAASSRRSRWRPLQRPACAACVPFSRHSSAAPR